MGNEFFKAGDLKQAKLKYYESEVALIQADGCSSEAATGLCGVYLNLSLIFFKQSDYTVARYEAQKALDIDDQNAKAWFRRGQANLALQKLQDSISDFETGLKLEPKNSDLVKNLAQAKDQLRKNAVNESSKKNLASLDGLYDNFVTEGMFGAGKGMTGMGDMFGAGKGMPGMGALGIDQMKEKMKDCQGMMGGLGLGLSDDDFYGSDDDSDSEIEEPLADGPGIETPVPEDPKIDEEQEMTEGVADMLRDYHELRKVFGDKDANAGSENPDDKGLAVAEVSGPQKVRIFGKKFLLDSELFHAHADRLTECMAAIKLSPGTLDIWSADHLINPHLLRITDQGRELLKTQSQSPTPEIT